MRISHFFAICVAIVLSGFQAHAACLKDKEATVEELIEAGTQGEKAFADGDIKQLRHWAGQAREEILPCLKLPLTPKSVAVFHRLMAIEALTRWNYKRVVAEFHAARRLDPGYQIPTEVAEGDHPLLTHYEEAVSAPDGEPEAIFAPEGGFVIVGGVRDAPRMKQTPVVIQVYDKGNVWIETRTFQPGDILPKWGVNPFGISAKDFGVDTQPLWQKPTPWYVTAGVLAIASVVTYAVAIDAKSDFNNPSTSDGDLPGLRDRANGLGWSAVGTGLGAIVFTGLAVTFQFAFDEDADDKNKTKPSVQVGVKR